jgi:hypothetical protein
MKREKWEGGREMQKRMKTGKEIEEGEEVGEKEEREEMKKWGSLVQAESCPL